MTSRPAVVISLERWDEVWRRNQHLLTRLRAHDVVGEVLYVEPSVDPLHNVRSRRRPQPGRGMRPLDDHPGITVLEPTKLLPRRADPWQDGRWARTVIAAANRLGLADPVLWVNDPRGAELLPLVDWPALYDITDDWLLADRPDTELQRLQSWEQRLLGHCREVVVCSPSLQRSKSLTRPVTLVPNGVDLELYAREHPRPTDLPSGRVVVYVGTLHSDRLDVDLCCATAKLIHDREASMVLIGPDALSAEQQSQLDAAGVVRLGARPAATVPAYLQHADVLVVPHLVTPFTESLDPIKAYEYAAAARPVVSTPVAGFRRFDSFALRSRGLFPRAVSDVLNAVPRGARSSPDTSIQGWQERASEFAVVLERLSRAVWFDGSELS